MTRLKGYTDKLLTDIASESNDEKRYKIILAIAVISMVRIEE